MNREQTQKRLMTSATEMRSKFFFHWSILSGATITLLIPLLIDLRSSQGGLLGMWYLKVGIVLLFIVLICSSLRNYFGSQFMFRIAKINSEGLTKITKKIAFELKSSTIIQYTLEVVSIVGYILSLVSLYMFLSVNLFK